MSPVIFGYTPNRLYNEREVFCHRYAPIIAYLANGTLSFVSASLQGHSYPDQAGVLIGGKGYSRYVMLEVHYNNPKLVKGE